MTWTAELVAGGAHPQNKGAITADIVFTRHDGVTETVNGFTTAEPAQVVSFARAWIANRETIEAWAALRPVAKLLIEAVKGILTDAEMGALAENPNAAAMRQDINRKDTAAVMHWAFFMLKAQCITAASFSGIAALCGVDLGA